MGLIATLYNDTYKTGFVLSIRPGAIFRDEYNEVLDSGTIVIVQRTTPIVISPFDVIVVSGDNFTTRRLVVDNVTERIISFDPQTFDYQINLFSETKLLENYLCPNLSITQPVDKSKTKSVGFYLEKYLEMYGPKIRIKNPIDVNSWIWASRFSFTSATLTLFNGIDCPELQWNTPTLREVLTDLMMVADRIPTLGTNQISSIDITAIGSEISSVNNINFVEKVITSNDAVTQLRLNMENSLTPKKDNLDVVTRKVEFVGFRNSDNNVFLETSNMEIVLDNPIYKLLRVTMFLPLSFATGSLYSFQEIDVTNHCVEKSIYDTLSTVPKSLDAYSKVEDDINKKQFNVFFSRGGRTISGWGNGFVVGSALLITFEEYPIDSMLAYIFGSRLFAQGADPISGFNRMDIVFRVEYETQGSIVADIGRTYLPNLNERTTFDNQTNAFVDVNAQGKFTQTKINRLGNDILMINGRYNNANDVPVLAQLFSVDYIVFSREISVFDDYVLVKMMAAKNYVLRDYFTGVSSRKRNFALDISNSFVRHDLVKFFAEFSFNPKFEKAVELDVIKPINLIPMNYLFAKAKPMITAGIRTLDFYDVNVAYPSVFGDLFGVDLDKKISGNSLLFTIAAKDNVSVGEKIVLRSVLGVNRRVQESYFYANQETGEFFKVQFFLIDDYNVGGGNVNFPVPQQFSFDTVPTVARDALINESRLKPLLKGVNTNLSDLSKRVPIFKDNKEILKITSQIEFCSDNRDIIFTEQFLKLQKFVNEKDYSEIRNFGMVKKSFYSDATDIILLGYAIPGGDLDASPFVGYSLFYRETDGVNLRIKEAVSQLDPLTLIPFWQNYPFTFVSNNLSGGSSYAVIHKVGNKFGVWNGRLDNSGFETPHFVAFDDTGVWPNANEDYIQIVSAGVANFASVAALKTALPPQNYKGGMIVANITGIGGGVYFALPVGIFTGPGNAYAGQTWEWVLKSITLLNINRVYLLFGTSTRYKWIESGFTLLGSNDLPVGWNVYVGSISAHRYSEYDVSPRGDLSDRIITITELNRSTVRIRLSGVSTGVVSWGIVDEDGKLLFAVNGSNLDVYLNVLNSRDTRVFDTVSNPVIIGTINNTTDDDFVV
jgi:hypothetical protein